MLAVSSAPRSIGAVVDDALKLWQSALQSTWLLTLMAAALAMGPYLWVFVVWRLTGTAPTVSIYRSGSVAFPIFTVSLWMLGSAVRYAMLIQTAAVASATPKPLAAALWLGFRLLPRTVVLKFIMLLAAMMLLIPAFVTIAVTRSAASFAAPALLTVTLLICFAMCLFGYLRVQLYPIYLVLGDVGAMDSLVSAWNLVRGHWWRVCAIAAIFAALYLVALAACSAVLGALYGMLGIPRALIYQFFQGTAALVSAFFAPVIAASRIQMFMDLKARAEGCDLAGRVATMTMVAL